MSDDSGWSDDEESPGVKAVFEKMLVKHDYIPDDAGAKKNHVAILRGDIVYVTNKDTDEEGIWEGEVKGYIGRFPASHVTPPKVLDGTTEGDIAGY